MKKTTSDVYSARCNFIVRALTEGKSRDEIANTLNYSTWRSLDMFMRRKGHYWDSKVQNYIPTQEKKERNVSINKSKGRVNSIITQFATDNAEARSIAKQVGFNDHREMAEYMKKKGYVWSPEVKNYVEFHGELQDAMSNTSQLRSIQESFDFTHSDSFESRVTENEQYLSLLKILDRNKERLIDLLMPTSETGIVPHYAVPGVTRTKSVYLSDSLCHLVAEFCGNKNLTQKQIYEAALIEFLKRYGFERKVESLLK